jgi:hypothetical protein
MFAFALVGTAMAVRWDALSIPYWVSTDVASIGVEDKVVEGEIDKSFETWQAVDCFDAVFPAAGRDKDGAFGDPPDGRNTVFVVTKNWPDEYKDSPFALDLEIDGSVIREGDIALNADFPFGVGGDGKTTYDIQSTVTHAIGLMLGLEETDDNGATMNPNMVGRTEGRDLDKDSDVPAICNLYPQTTGKDTGIPTRSEQGDPCTRAEDCTDGFVCVVDNGDEYCATRCGTDGACPSGTSCEDPGSGSPVCIVDRETGCAVVPRTSAGFLGLALAALALRARTRR